MELEKYLETFLGTIMSNEGIEEVKKIVKADLEKETIDYNTTSVEFQVLTEKDNVTPRVEITSENYSDGEVIFIDYHLDDKEFK